VGEKKNKQGRYYLRINPRDGEGILRRSRHKSSQRGERGRGEKERERRIGVSYIAEYTPKLGYSKPKKSEKEEKGDTYSRRGQRSRSGRPIKAKEEVS